MILFSIYYHLLENEYIKYKEARKNTMSQPSKKTSKTNNNMNSKISNKKQKL